MSAPFRQNSGLRPCPFSFRTCLRKCNRLLASGSYYTRLFFAVLHNYTKSWILDAAAILFTQNGFTKTTTKAIAELAGVSESTFFRIYKSKAALLSDLLYIMTPGPEDIPMKEMTNGTDIRKDFELFLYHNALLHVRHLPVFRLAMHVEEIYDKPGFPKSKG